jgi:hypothetical protein
MVDFKKERYKDREKNTWLILRKKDIKIEKKIHG